MLVLYAALLALWLALIGSLGINAASGDSERSFFEVKDTTCSS